MKRSTILLILAVFLVGGVFAQAQSDLQILAVVKLKGSDAITLGALKSKVAMYKQMKKADLTLAERKDVLQGLINEKLLLQAAEKDNIIVSDAEVNEAFLNEISSLVSQRITEAQFEQLLLKQYNMSLDDYYQARMGMSVAEYKKAMKKQLIGQKYIISTKGPELKKLSVASHEEILDYFSNHEDDFIQPKTATLFYVVIPNTPDPAVQKKYADELLASVKSGKMTQEKMIAATEAGETKYQAGYVYVGKKEGVAQQLEMSKEEFESLYTTKVGTYSNVEEIKANNGRYRFYCINKVTPLKALTINDILEPNTTRTVYKYIESIKTMEKQRDALITVTQQITDSLRKNDTVQMNKTNEQLDKLLSNW